MNELAIRRNSISEDSIRYPGWDGCVAAFAGVMVTFAAIMPYTVRTPITQSG
jgi:hypothetical protein